MNMPSTSREVFLALATAGLLLAACNPMPRTGHGSQPSTSPKTSLFPAANLKSVELDGENYSLSQAKSYPLIDSWVYNRAGESTTRWSKRFEINRYKKVDAREIFYQMQVATANQLHESHADSRTICFVTEREDGQLKEVNIWKYTDTEAKNGKKNTYSNGIIWQFPAGERFNTFMKGEFGRTCAAMRTLPFVTPPSL